MSESFYSTPLLSTPRLSRNGTDDAPDDATVQPTKITSEDTQLLRRYVRDLSLLVLPTPHGSDSRPSNLAEGLADLLVSSLSLDWLYLRLGNLATSTPVEVARLASHQDANGRTQELGQALAPWLNGIESGLPPIIRNPLASGLVHLAVAPVGNSAYGVIIAGARRPDFPTEAEQLLLELTGNQAALGLQRQRAEEELAARRQTEEALYRSELQFRSVLENLPAGAYTCDPAGLITYFNPQAVHLWGRAPKLNDPVDRYCGSFRLFAADGMPIRHDQCWMALALQTGKEYCGQEIMVERPDGTRLPVLAYATPIHGRSGNLLAAVNVLVDISAQKRAEEALREGDRRKDEFLATLAHELRNPLAPIRNALQVLRMTSASADPTVARLREIMERQVNHMVRLVDDLLEVSRITSGKIDLRKERVELADVIRSALETSRPIIDAAHHQFSVSLPPNPVYLEADAVRLAQVIANLLNNAAKYTEEGGQIWLTARRAWGEVVVSVRDNGLGIPAEMLPQVFDMFAQVNRTLKRAQGGLGIGLGLARNLVELHGGTIEAYSAGIGQGSEFLVRLPLSEDAAPCPETAWPAEDRASPAGPGRRILLVDDNRDAADSLGMVLKSLGNEIHIAHDGKAALAAVRAYQPEVVLLDIGMPGMDGYEVARTLRRQPELKGVALIALTGWAQEEDRRRAQAAGFDHHLTKPVELDTLQALLNSVVQCAEMGRPVG